MQRARPIRTERGRLLIAVLAALALVLRVLAPMPAVASAPSDLTTQLEALGAGLCHADPGSTEPDPAGPPACDHCPLCTVGGLVPFLPSVVALAPPAPAHRALSVPAARDTAARPRAPPGHAHPPRAPPTV